MKRDIRISVKCESKNKLLIKIYELGISISNIKYEQKYLKFDVSFNDYLKLKKYIKSYNFIVINKLGALLLKEKINKNKIIIINTLLAVILMFFFSNLIVSVNVIHSKKYIREIVISALEENGVKKLSFKKNYKQLSKIKEKILKMYPEDLEWIEIEKKGMNYIVRIEERIITKDNPTKDMCNLVATKSGVITDVVSSKGQVVKEINDYVKQGDIIVSGNIMFNEEIKNIVCATGTVKAEVWYSTEVSLPINYEEKIETNKKRYNFAFNDYKIFKSRLNNYNTKKKKIFSIFGNKFYLLTEKEIIFKKKKYSEDEALKKSIELSNEKINTKLKEGEKIIKQNVLKNTLNNSTMYVEIFTSVEEIISKQENLVLEEKEVE